MNVEEAALRVSDGENVAWDDVERSVETSDLEVVRNLRVLRDLASAVWSEAAARLSNDEALEATTGVARGLAAEGAWGRFSLRERLGEGAYAEVWKAWDPKLEREVALKLLKKTPAREAAVSTALREGRLLARVRHPNVVTVFDADETDGRVGIAMELVRGLSLRDLVRSQGRLSARETMLIGIDVLKALSELHRSGLVHRDLKGANVMREEGGRIVLMDFGTVVDAADLRASEAPSLTGTPLWMAPELFGGAAGTVRSDLYSVGVLLYHLVTGTHPVEARTLSELEDKHRRGEVRLLRDVRPDLPESFLRVVGRALSPDPGDRYATAGEMAAALSIALGGDERAAPTTRRRGIRAVLPPLLGAAAVLVLALAGFLLLRTQEAPTASTPVPPPPAPEASYAVEASLNRIGKGGLRERLDPGARLSLGDRLTLSFRASRSVYLYVIDEDEVGNAYALFPLPNLAASNPLAAGITHELPGLERDGKTSRSWQVTNAGGREHLLLLASPKRLVEFEAEMNALPRPLPGQAALPIPGAARARLRGIGALGDAPSAPGASATRLFDLARELASPKETVEGVWLRQIVLENPQPAGPR